MSEAPRVSVPSPCRDVCQLDAAGVCVGCGRTIAEISEWTRADSERRLQIRSAARARVEQALEAAQRGEIVDRGPR
ncbi:MAG: DUF1289 domain-containing protein [Gammaproteobacteria bacterium]|nr:DUF1289 domain-containing protein [Gammaproteobacteria bacterium]MDE2250868.1 DUF1289 domain-containing protein [Gammaproteobacteria bacterium]